MIQKLAGVDWNEIQKMREVNFQLKVKSQWKNMKLIKFGDILFTVKQYPLLNTVTQYILQDKLLLHMLKEVSYGCVDYVQWKAEAVPLLLSNKLNKNVNDYCHAEIIQNYKCISVYIAANISLLLLKKTFWIVQHFSSTNFKLSLYAWFYVIVRCLDMLRKCHCLLCYANHEWNGKANKV